MTSIAAHGESSATCYLNEIPDFVGPELARLYQTLHSSLPFFELFRSTDGVNCYVARRGGRPVHIFVFALRGNCLEVFNEMIEVGEEELQRFAEHVFARFAHVDLIRFRAIRTGSGHVGYPTQKYGAKTTYCIALPPTPEAYTESLGKGTRGDLKRKLDRVGKALPLARVEFRSGDEVDASSLHAIMTLGETNLAARGVGLRHDREKIIALAQRCGFVSALLVDARIVAGSINYQVGASYFADLQGYDNEYERLGIGSVCTHHTIRESIRRGGQRFYLGGGHFAYKQHMGGVLQHMDELKMYRSRRKMLANPQHAAGIVVSAGIRAGKEFLHRNRDHALARLVFSGAYLLKNRSAK
jgi:hypothetical protein